MNKYKFWWIICVTICSFILFNCTLFALTGLTLIKYASGGQVFAQAIVFIFFGMFTFIPTINGDHRK
jgi:uncharacterized membrane protein YhaH (DUF805 family)